jgi:phytoene synthase
MRDPASIVYAWCRRADDAIDDAEGQAQRRALRRLRAELDQVYAGNALTDPVLASFQRVVFDAGIPRHYPSELLAGMEMDAFGFEYQTWQDLFSYCYRVASTVGLMMCHVMGVRDEAALRHAAHLGVAMQLTNIARDVREDWRRGRLYLPVELLKQHDLGHMPTQRHAPFPKSARAGCAGALRELLSVADNYYASGKRGLRYLSPRCELAVRAASAVYSAIGDEIARRQHDVAAPRAVVPKHEKVLLCAAAALRTVARRRSLAHLPFTPTKLEAVYRGSSIVLT